LALELLQEIGRITEVKSSFAWEKSEQSDVTAYAALK